MRVLIDFTRAVAVCARLLVGHSSCPYKVLSWFEAVFRRGLFGMWRLAVACLRRNAALVRSAVLEYLPAAHYVDGQNI